MDANTSRQIVRIVNDIVPDELITQVTPQC